MEYFRRVKVEFFRTLGTGLTVIGGIRGDLSDGITDQ
jgi:hypothetical protein